VFNLFNLFKKSLHIFPLLNLVLVCINIYFVTDKLYELKARFLQDMDISNMNEY